MVTRHNALLNGYSIIINSLSETSECVEATDSLTLLAMNNDYSLV